ncbi:MAG: winged helix-turn-helix domain-containing protein [Gammaproteobacteria bacterium]|nr:winged helix-turn-helix domain-containing protein [Gammaproteobacteria bacterium]
MTRQIRFGDWCFQPDTHMLAIGELQNVLEPKVARLLEYFLAHPDEVLSHDQLVNAVWDGRVISDEAVRRGISSLRHALAADGSNGYIKTIHKKGYLADFPPPLAESPDLALSPQNPDLLIAPAQSPIPPSVGSASRAGWRLLRPGFGFLALVVLLALGVYFLHQALREVPPPASSRVAASAPVTIAVLSFLNLSEDAGSGYFSDGLAEELLGLLAQVDAFQVTARSSSFQFKANQEDVRAVGRRLGVRYVLEGSVRKASDKVRIGVQLTDAQSGYNVWSETYERRLGDTFAVQQEIARNVVRKLQVAIVSTGDPLFNESSTASIEAHDEYLQARNLLATWVVSDADAAADHLQRAIALDPDYAAAYALLADAILIRASANNSVANAREVVAPLVRKALELEPGLGDAYVTRSWLSDDPAQRERDLRRGLELNPSSARGYAMLADLLASSSGRREEAFRLIDRARALDPLMPNNHHVKARMLVQQGQWAEAELLEKLAIELDPRFRAALVRLGNLSALKGDFAAAVTYGERATAIDPAPSGCVTSWYGFISISTICKVRSMPTSRPLPWAAWRSCSRRVSGSRQVKSFMPSTIRSPVGSRAHGCRKSHCCMHMQPVSTHAPSSWRPDAWDFTAPFPRSICPGSSSSMRSSRGCCARAVTKPDRWRLPGPCWRSYRSWNDGLQASRASPKLPAPSCLRRMPTWRARLPRWSWLRCPRR